MPKTGENNLRQQINLSNDWGKTSKWHGFCSLFRRMWSNKMYNKEVFLLWIINFAHNCLEIIVKAKPQYTAYIIISNISWDRIRTFRGAEKYKKYKIKYKMYKKAFVMKSNLALIK